MRAKFCPKWKPLKPPFSYYGGKSTLAKWIVPLLPSHKYYIEVFGGSGAILFAKPPASFEVYNDIDGELVNFFRVLRDEELGPLLIHRLNLTLHSRQELLESPNITPEMTPVQRAEKLFILARQSFSSKMDIPTWNCCKPPHENHPNPNKIILRREMGAATSRWLGSVERLPELYTRMRRVQVDNQPFQKVLKRYDHKDALFYLDPPYMMSHRHDVAYRYEMTEEQHEELIDCILSLKGKAAVSGYCTPLYGTLDDHGFTRHEKQRRISAQQVFSGSRQSYRTEVLWTKG